MVALEQSLARDRVLWWGSPSPSPNPWLLRLWLLVGRDWVRLAVALIRTDGACFGVCTFDVGGVPFSPGFKGNGCPRTGMRKGLPDE